MNEVLMIVMAAGALLGGFDRLRGNKWGFGDKFETGFMLLVRPFAWLGDKLGMKPQSLTGMLVGLVSAMPTLSMYKDMDGRGKVAAGAFLVSGTSLLAAHMGFVISTEPELLGALIAGKLSGAIAAVLLALCVQKREVI